MNHHNINSLQGIQLTSPLTLSQRLSKVGTSFARTFESLAYRDFRLLWFASLATSLAIQIQIYARGWLIFDLTDSAVALTWVMLSFWIPSSVFSFLGGALGDRIRKKTIMVGAQVASMLSALTFGTLILIGDEKVPFWYFIVFGFFNGTILALSMPTRTAVMPDLVAPRHLTNALSLSASTFNLSRVVGIALGGLLLSAIFLPLFSPTISVGLLFLCIASLYGCSIVGTLLIHYQGNPTRVHKKSLARDFWEGVVYLRNSRVVVGLLLMGLIPTMFGFSAQFLLPAFNGRLFEGKSETLSGLLVALGVGAVLGSLTIARYGEVDQKGRLMYVLAFLWAFFLAILALSTTYWVALIVLALVGASSAGLSSLNMSVLQLIVSAKMRSRIMAITWACFGLMPIGMIPLGFMAEKIGLQTAFLSCAGLMFVGIVCTHFVAPEVAKIRRGHKDHAATVQPSQPHESEDWTEPRATPATK